jgi:hypothetical protein
MDRTWVSGAVVVVLLAAGPATRGQDKEALALIRKGIEAAGGQKVLESLKAAQSKSKGTIHYPPPTGDVAVVAEEFLQLPDKVRSNIQATVGGRQEAVVVVYDGQKGWIKKAGKTEDLDAKGLAEMKATLYESRVGGLLELLKDKEFQLSAAGEAKVDGRPAVGILVKHPGQRDIRLYFDKANGLLVKTATQALDALSGKEVSQEKVFADYKAVSGRQVPHKVSITQNGRPYMEVEITEVRIVERLDPTLFAQPK